jgi:hypothetical protein
VRPGLNTLRGNDAPRRDRGGPWAALLVVLIVVAAVWGAWRLGVLAGGGASWRPDLPTVPEALRKTPMPNPPNLPTQRRPAVDPTLRS